MPLLLCAASLGAIRASHWMAGATGPACRRAILAMAALLLMQVAAAHAFAVIYRALPLGPTLWLAPEGLPAHYRGFFSGG